RKTKAAKSTKRNACLKCEPQRTPNELQPRNSRRPVTSILGPDVSVLAVLRVFGARSLGHLDPFGQVHRRAVLQANASRRSTCLHSADQSNHASSHLELRTGGFRSWERKHIADAAFRYSSDGCNALLSMGAAKRGSLGSCTLFSSLSAVWLHSWLCCP